MQTIKREVLWETENVWKVGKEQTWMDPIHLIPQMLNTVAISLPPTKLVIITSLRTQYLISCRRACPTHKSPKPISDTTDYAVQQRSVRRPGGRFFTVAPMEKSETTGARESDKIRCSEPSI